MNDNIIILDEYLSQPSKYLKIFFCQYRYSDCNKSHFILFFQRKTKAIDRCARQKMIMAKNREFLVKNCENYIFNLPPLLYFVIGIIIF